MFALTNKPDEFLDDRLPAIVSRMGLAAHDDLHRPLFVVQDAQEAIRIMRTAIDRGLTFIELVATIVSQVPIMEMSCPAK